ncbi:hypothetical protein RUM44_007669 [Polyplax serrata]|uniref:Bifunctional lysine-specific demethylase and histidyl-hydroxylase n=1 Tax=Polyplax serrata TaxID=468196 RepID=A0ABR1BAL4_POLSC
MSHDSTTSAFQANMEKNKKKYELKHEKKVQERSKGEIPIIFDYKKKSKAAMSSNGNLNGTLQNGTNKRDNLSTSDSINRSRKRKNKLLEGDTRGTHSVNEFNDQPDVEKFKKTKKKAENSNNIDQIIGTSIHRDSVKIGEDVFAWMISPVEVRAFFSDCWESKPLHISKNKEDFFESMCSLSDFKKAVMDNDMYFGKNIDVTSYVNSERLTHNKEGKATLPILWDYFESGCSIRLLNPQRFIPNIKLLMVTLQEFFHCFVGSNIYLTPPGTQGFAPHYDDIEAFVLQLDGEKQWKIYKPRVPEDVLPRYSSRNLSQDEIGEPEMEVTLKPGDVLYFPRGMIHQASCPPHTHSLHVTLSCYQRNTWGDLFEKMLPVAIERAITEDVEFRKGLPLGYMNHFGLAFSDQATQARRQLIEKFNELGRRLIKFCPLDAAVDQMAVDFVHSALPPSLTNEEKLHGADRNIFEDGKSLLDVLKAHPNGNLSVRLIRLTSVRLVSEEEQVFLYYTTDNSLVYRENDVVRTKIPRKWIAALEHLIHSYPDYVTVKTLPVMKQNEKSGKWMQVVRFVYFLWQRGLILFDRPCETILKSLDVEN